MSDPLMVSVRARVIVPVNAAPILTPPTCPPNEASTVGLFFPVPSNTAIEPPSGTVSPLQFAAVLQLVSAPPASHTRTMPPASLAIIQARASYQVSSFWFLVSGSGDICAKAEWGRKNSAIDFQSLEVYDRTPMRVSLSFLDVLFTPPWLRILSAVSTDLFVVWLAASVRSLTVFNSISLTFNTALASMFLFFAVKAETLLERPSCIS